MGMCVRYALLEWWFRWGWDIVLAWRRACCWKNATRKLVAYNTLLPSSKKKVFLRETYWFLPRPQCTSWSSSGYELIMTYLRLWTPRFARHLWSHNEFYAQSELDWRMCTGLAGRKEILWRRVYDDEPVKQKRSPWVADLSGDSATHSQRVSIYRCRSALNDCDLVDHRSHSR